MTPHRISFAGGGTDYPKIYKKYNGAVINSAINKYLFVSVKSHGKMFYGKYRLLYSKSEICNKVSDIKNNIARECLKLVPVDQPITISTTSDLPPESGTGSSSCFAVGLLHALHTFRGERVSPNQLASEACKIEIDKLKKISGKQDQYSAAFGGINKFIFKRNNEVQIVPIDISVKNLEILFDSLKLVWTGVQRDSSKVAKTYTLTNRQKDYIGLLQSNVSEFQTLLENKKLNLSDISKLIRKTWLVKREFSNSISNKTIENISLKLDKIKIEGHRLIGAGAGGFFLCLLNNRSKVIKLKKKFNQNEILEVDYEPHGSRIVSLIYN